MHMQRHEPTLHYLAALVQHRARAVAIPSRRRWRCRFEQAMEGTPREFAGTMRHVAAVQRRPNPSVERAVSSLLSGPVLLLGAALKIK